jgi:hypothetical protein
MPSWSLPISTLPEIRERIDGAKRILNRSRLVAQGKGGSFAALLGPHHLHRKPLTLLQTAQSGTLDYGDVYEHILSSILADHEAKPLFGIEPLDRAFDLDGGRRIGAPAAVGRRAR